MEVQEVVEEQREGSREVVDAEDRSVVVERPEDEEGSSLEERLEVVEGSHLEDEDVVGIRRMISMYIWMR